MLVAERRARRVLAVGASRESYLLDYANERARFMINFGDGAAAALLARTAARTRCSARSAITDGSLSLPRQGARRAAASTPTAAYRFLDVVDQAAMKERLDEVSLPNFVRAAEGALGPLGRALADVDYLCGIHMKRSMHDALVAALGVDPERAAYLDDAGHMSGVDPLLALDRARDAGELARRRPRAAARRGHRLHVGREGRPLGADRGALGEPERTVSDLSS